MENRKELLTPEKLKRTSIQTSLKNQFTNTVLSQPFKISTVIKRLLKLITWEKNGEDFKSLGNNLGKTVPAQK